MQILFVISILCFVALVWAVVAIARRIATGHKSEPAGKQSHANFAHHLFAATENRETRHPRAVRPQTVHDIAARKGWNSGPASIEIHPIHDENGPSMEGLRKSPKTSHHHGGTERLDWAYFNKDAGDLTDPYQIRRFRASSGAKATSSKRY
jgi:hypothetical protein